MNHRPEPKKEQPVPLVCTKEPYKEPNAPRRIQQIRFDVQTPQEIAKCGVLAVYERALYKKPERTPLANGVLDRRLGVSNKNYVCETCGQKLAECAGHFGYIKLELPVFHIGYFKNTIQLLQCICKTCSRVLLPEAERQVWLKRFRNPRVERTQREGMFKKVIDRCKRTKVCTRCGEYNGVVKKVPGVMKIVHERYLKNPAALEEYKASLSAAATYNDQIKQYLPKLSEDLQPLLVRKLFERVSAEDLDVLDIVGRPETLLVSHVAVPPVCIRPSVEMDGASNEDDITMKLMQIIEVNTVMRQGLTAGLTINQLAENWEFLQVTCGLLINSDMPGIPLQYQQPGRPLRGFVQRLKGKQGRFRGNLSGKRVDFSGRTVISPDPNLAINQVCVPQHMAVILTFPERVTMHNIEKLRKRVLNGLTTWPGANFVIQPNGEKLFLKFGDRRKTASDLKIGDIVERHLEDGDVVLFNRQPSLHRISIMAFRAKVRTYRTLRFNECVCSPFNADFDGDEMNLHLPQTEEARTEAIELMGSVNNLCTPKNGEIMISATQDFLTCAYLVSSKDRFYNRAEFCSLASMMSDGLEALDLPTPALIKPLEMWTGKQLFSMLLRPNAQTRIFVNMELAEKVYTKKGLHLCPMDGWVCFRNSTLICGRIGKVVLGGTKGGLFDTLNSDYSAGAAAAVMSRLAKMAARHMGNRGFSIGIDDVTPRDKLQQGKAAMLDKGYQKCRDTIVQYKKGCLELSSGSNAEQTLESSVKGVLDNIRDSAGSLCMDTLHWHNSPLIMSQCGSKGSPINIAQIFVCFRVRPVDTCSSSIPWCDAIIHLLNGKCTAYLPAALQMLACVGQQSVSGKRAFNGFKERTLPHYPRGDKTPAGKGFVANSFYSGLTATEFWFHTMGGREGLVDTAVKTAETGYMSRRLMKALEDLYCHYDNTVRNAARGIVQLCYGEDGLDPVIMEGEKGHPLDFERTLAKVRAMTPQHQPLREGGQSGVPLPSDLSKAVAKALDCMELREPEVDMKVAKVSQDGKTWCSEAYRRRLSAFLKAQVEAYKTARKTVGLEEETRGLDALEYLAGLSGLTLRQLDSFMHKVLTKYERKRIDPGSTVGAVGAQSIGEPGTQMTLKTFHFAGVASMNVTQGVPRIKEIINGAKHISTPIITVYLESDMDESNARLVANRLQKTTLGQVAHHIRIVLKPGSSSAGHHGNAHISVTLNLGIICSMMLEIDAYSVRTAILHHPRIKLKDIHVRAVREDKIVISAPDEADPLQLMFQLQALVKVLPQVIVSGIPTVDRNVVTRSADKPGAYTLLLEGTNFLAVMATAGVNCRNTISNSIHEVEKTLGIEAARKKIMTEIKYTMDQHKMAIDERHTMLLADCMSYKGEVLGITRFGIAKMKDSVLHTASFEKTADHLFDAAIHGRIDDVVGVSESIIMGIPMPVGTGLFKLRHLVPEVGNLAIRPTPALNAWRSAPQLQPLPAALNAARREAGGVAAMEGVEAADASALDAMVEG